MPNTTKKQDSYGGLYDADNGVMLTGEISQDMLGGYNKTVLQYANKGLAQNMVSQGALGDHVLRQAFVGVLQHGFVIAAQHILTDFTGQHDAVVSIVQSAVAILFFGGVWHRVVDTEFGPRARPWLPATMLTTASC